MESIFGRAAVYSAVRAIESLKLSSAEMDLLNTGLLIVMGGLWAVVIVLLGICGYQFAKEIWTGTLWNGRRR